MAFGVAALKEHFSMFGYSTHACAQSNRKNLSPIYLQTPWAGEEKAVRPKDQRGRTFNVHTTGFINYWNNGKSSYNLLQEVGCYAEWEKGCSLQQYDWLDTLPWASVWWEHQSCQSEKPDLLLLKEHFTNLLNYRQLKASFRLSNLWLQSFVMSKLYIYFSFLYLYCH